MNAYAEQKQENQSRAVANALSQQGQVSTARSPRPHLLSALQESANHRPQVRRVAQMQQMLNQSPRTRAPIQRKENNTAMPDHLKEGLEHLSGMSLDGTSVHYNSSEPARFGANAITQGKDIHVGPGQERHLAHEGWHVIQQRQGRVKPTMQMHGAALNDDSALEREADVMGERAAQVQPTVQRQHHGEGLEAEAGGLKKGVHTANQHSPSPVAQRMVVAVPGTIPQQYRSTLISDRVFNTLLEAQIAEQAHLAAIQTERQRRAEEEWARQEEQRRMFNPMFAPPSEHYAPNEPMAMNTPPTFQHLLNRQLGLGTRGETRNVGQQLSIHRDLEEELTGLDPQLHQFAWDPYGGLGES